LNTYSSTGNYALGLQNSDEAKVSQALLVRTTIAPKTTATLNASNVYDVGVYEVSKTAAAEALGYAATNPKITVTQAPLTIAAKDASKVYDGGAYSLGNGLSYSGFVAGEGSAALGGSAVYAGAAQGAVNAGTYALTASGLTSKNYSITYSPGTLTVSPKGLTIRVNDDARFVGQTDTAGYAGASYTGFVTGQSISTLGSLSITRTATSAAGTYTAALQASIPGLTNTNYSITYVPGNYTIVPADQLLVKFNNTAATYAADPVYSLKSAQYLKSSTNTVIDLTSSASVVGSTFNLVDSDGGSTSFTVGAQSASLSNAGKLNAFGGYQLGASSVTNSSANYNNSITTTGALTVNPKAVSASVGSGLSKTYDGNAGMPAMSLTLSGALAADKVSVTGQGAYASANAGTTNYDVKNLTLGGVDQGNYVLTAGNSMAGTNGVINKAALTVTAQSDRKIYDGEAYLGGHGVVISGLVNNEVSTVLSGTLSYTGDSQNAINAGAYTITPQGLSSNNYSIKYFDAALTVEPVTITTTPITGVLQGPITKVYDGTDTATLTSANYILTGWVSTDSATVKKASGAYDNANVGNAKLVSVSLTPDDYLADGTTVLTNYVLPTSITGTVGAITAKPLTVTGLTATNKTYDGNPSVAISNWGAVATGVANESLILLPGVASFADANAQTGKSVTATGYSLANGKGGVASNYVLTNSASTASADITQKSVTVTGVVRTTTYDGVSTYADLTSNTGFTSSALAQGDWVSSVTKVAGEAGATASAVAQAGSYTVTPSSAVMGVGLASNYSFSYLPGSNKVDKAALTVAANAANKAYDGKAYSGGNGVSYAGFVNSEDSKVLSGTLAYAGSSQGAVNAGSYPITLSGVSSSNYTLGYTDGTLKVSPATLTASLAGNVTKVYDGSSVATLASGNFLLNGFVGGEGATVTKSAGSYDNSNVGTGKTVMVSALTSTDYAANSSTLLSNYVLPTTVSGALGSITQLASVTYIGATGGNWSLASNWAGGAIPTLGNVATVVIPAGSSVVFDDANLGALTPTSAISNSGTLGFANSAALSFANAISGPGMLSKAGAGTLSLSGTNTYSGSLGRACSARRAPAPCPCRAPTPMTAPPPSAPACCGQPTAARWAARWAAPTSPRAGHWSLWATSRLAQRR
ncbi:MAG: hypothetical protein EBY28_20990, partial [Betaproteobacteria bacterium]|nr:hypothetical protein [Betaproteobacteria bacterium]